MLKFDTECRSNVNKAEIIKQKHKCINFLLFDHIHELKRVYTGNDEWSEFSALLVGDRWIC